MGVKLEIRYAKVSPESLARAKVNDPYGGDLQPWEQTCPFIPGLLPDSGSSVAFPPPFCSLPWPLICGQVPSVRTQSHLPAALHRQVHNPHPSHVTCTDHLYLLS